MPGKRWAGAEPCKPGGSWVGEGEDVPGVFAAKRTRVPSMGAGMGSSKGASLLQPRASLLPAWGTFMTPSICLQSGLL